MRADRPVLAITSGDPCGVGPEIILKALAQFSASQVQVVVIGDLEVFEQASRRLHMALPAWALRRACGFSPGNARLITFIDIAHPRRFRFGHSSEHAGRACLDYLDAAVGLARQGLIKALVTAPVTKWAIERARGQFVGHTEYLAGALGAKRVVMMFVSRQLRVVLLTRHVALREVALRLTRGLLRQTVLLTVDGLRRHFCIRKPRLALCGLNPHAGEEGLFGDEERRVLLPVLRGFAQEGFRIEGPFAADGLFARLSDPARAASVGLRYDAVICPYHDQGLIPFKMLSRYRGCQLSLGLPIVRTSPDHGSALDIAGKGVANPGSMRYALQLAARLVSRQRPRA